MMGTDYADTYDPETDFDRFYTIATSRAIAARVRPGDHVLELGCATGLMSSEIMQRSSPASWVGIDRSQAFLERARTRGLTNAIFTSGDLDHLRVEEGHYQHILATNVLHELADPAEFLRRCVELLADGDAQTRGQIHITLQNPHSIHRLCAYELGMITSLTQISDRGTLWGTRGLWTAEQLQELANAAGLTVVAREGIMLKPLPNKLMAELDEEVIEGFIRAAVHLPEVCAMNYLVLSRD